MTEGKQGLLCAGMKGFAAHDEPRACGQSDRSTQRGELSHRGARPVFAVLADRGLPASPEPLPSGRDPRRQGSTEAEPVLEDAQRMQPDMRHGLVATQSHLRTVLLLLISGVPSWLGDPKRRERQNPLPGR
jgi:hypothetical protein